MPLTPKQKELLDYISGFTTKEGYAPSQIEIAKHFGFRSLGTVQDYLVRLEKEGFLKKKWNAKRSLSVKIKSVHQRAQPILPLLGRVAAGKPIENFETQEEIEVPHFLITKPEEQFVLQVIGNSMIEDGILDGDLVIVKKQKSAESNSTLQILITSPSL